jgi:hypothetical protein
MLHNEELHSLYRSHNTIRVIKSSRLIWAGHLDIMEKCSSFKISTGKPKGKRPLGRSRHRNEDNIRWILKKYVSIRGIGLIRLRIGMRHWTSGYQKPFS